MSKTKQHGFGKGHWFCDHCDDVVFLTYEKTNQKDVPCPSCGHLAANFIPSQITREILGHAWFDAMRRAVDEATTPDMIL
jgi:hypothetical protein